jgi:hypothetical protein
MCKWSILAGGVTFLTGLSVSSSEREVRNGIKGWKARVVSSAERQEVLVGLQFSNK